MSSKLSLGRGFDSLIPKDLDRSLLEEDKMRIQNLLITDIYPNPEQPRRQFNEQDLSELTASIKVHGVMQPIIVVKENSVSGVSGSYKIVAGERRWRAAGHAKLKEVPAIVRSLKELEQIELALIENIQRVDLSPLEQALAVYRLQHQFNLSLEEVAKKLGKGVSTVSNLGRLLQLPDEARDALQAGKISEGHARAILALKGNEAKQMELLRCILSNGWSVRQAEMFVQSLKKSDDSPSTKSDAGLTAGIGQKLDAKVTLKRSKQGGQIIISYKDPKDLLRITRILTSDEE